MKKLPSVLQIIADGSPGGGTTVVLGLCEDLNTSGNWNVTLITQPHSYAFEQARMLGIKVIAFDFFISRFDWTVSKRLLILIESVRPDLIHVHGSRAAFPFCFSPLKRLICPMIYTVHGYHFRFKKGILKWLGWLAEWRIAHRCDILTWVSKGDQAIAERWRLKHANRSISTSISTVIYNGIQPSQFADILPRDKRYDLVFAGRMDTPKNPLFMIDILTCLKSSSVSLLMIGGGKLENKLLAYAKSKDLENLITFTSSLSQNEALLAINSARVLILPSLWEAFGMVVVEAGYLGLPVIAANISGVDEIIVDGKNGYLIPGHDPEKFAEAISFLLDNPSVAAEMGGQAKQMVEEKFLRQSSSSQYMEIYHSLINK